MNSNRDGILNGQIPLVVQSAPTYALKGHTIIPLLLSPLASWKTFLGGWTLSEEEAEELTGKHASVLSVWF